MAHLCWHSLRCLIVAMAVCFISVVHLGVFDAAHAKPLRRIGVLLVSWSTDSKLAQAFREGLRDAGYVEGRDVAIEWRSARGDYDRIPELIDELIKSKVELIVSNGTVGTRAAKRATSTIPIVMAVVADPLGSGLVSDLAHPEGNVTGNTIMSPELSAKRLQILKELVPQATHVAVLWNPDSPYSQKVIEELKVAARSLSVDLALIGTRSPEDIAPGIRIAAQGHAQALYVIEDPLFDSHRAQFLKLVSKARLPVVYWASPWPEEGGLMSYGPKYRDLFYGLAAYVDRILKGAKPADLPIEQPSTFELVVNVKTAKALGLTIPQSVMLRADEVIQ